MKNNTVPYITIPRKSLKALQVRSLQENSSQKLSVTTFALIIFLCVSVLTGCAVFGKKGSASQAEAKHRAQIVNVDNKIAANTSEKLDTIAGLAYGTDYALGKVNEPPREVTVARDMNQRVMSLSGSPTIEKMKEMQAIIDELTSTLELERTSGKKKLDLKDIEIAAIQTSAKELTIAKDNEIKKYMSVAQETAADRDAYKAELQEYQGWFGLKAVAKGLWQFVKSSMWILGIGGVLFIILRFAASTNPIAASIFGIFEQMIAWVINAIKVVFPKALSIAGTVSKEVYDKANLLLKKIVDNIQSIKEIEKRTGKDITLKELFVELDKSMDQAERDMIIKIKKDLGYN